MKIKFIGTGSSINSKRIGASVLIEDSILIDAPPAANSILWKDNINFEKISHIFISHLHGDHYFGLPFVLMEYGLKKKVSELKIYGPHSLEDNVKNVLRLGFPNEDFNIIKENSKSQFYKLNNVINVEPLRINVNPFKVQHLDMEAYGFIVDNACSKTLITADTELFEGLEKNIIDCACIIIDGTTLKGGLKGHISFEEIEMLAERFPLKKFYITHRGEYSYKNKKNNIFLPIDGEVINV
ncbi:MAG: ribonuclease Z [Eubacterium sp.]|nr:ribonuclease Z [Eubacterium sp.]